MKIKDGMQIEQMADRFKELIEQRRAFQEEYIGLVEEGESRIYDRVSYWSNLVSSVQKENWSKDLSAFQAVAKSMSSLLGLGIKEQAMIMIPFEVAEATKEMAKFLATGDPMALASSLQHALAVKQYAQAARTSAPSASRASGASGTRSKAGVGEGAEQEVHPGAKVIVNVGEGIVTNPKEFARQIIDGINEAYRDNVNIEFV